MEKKELVDMKKKTKNKKNYLKTMLIVLVAGLVVWGLFALMSELTKAGKDNARESSETEINQGEKEEDGGTDLPESPEVDEETGLKKVAVSISAAGVSGGMVYAGGEVENSTDQTGICTYVFNSPDGNVITVETETLPSANSVVCSEAKSDATRRAKGTWSVVLKYKSATAEGSSESVSFEVD